MNYYRYDNDFKSTGDIGKTMFSGDGLSVEVFHLKKDTSIMNSFEKDNLVNGNHVVVYVIISGKLEIRIREKRIVIEEGEILVLSFDGVSENALELVKQGKIACIAECNPHHGPRVSSIILNLHEGKNIEKTAYVDESIFAYSDIVKTVTIEDNIYAVDNIGMAVDK